MGKGVQFVSRICEVFFQVSGLDRVHTFKPDIPIYHIWSFGAPHIRQVCCYMFTFVVLVHVSKQPGSRPNHEDNESCGASHQSVVVVRIMVWIMPSIPRTPRMPKLDPSTCLA